MFKVKGKLQCGTCPLDEKELEARMERIEERRARIAAKMAALAAQNEVDSERLKHASRHESSDEEGYEDFTEEDFLRELGGEFDGAKNTALDSLSSNLKQSENVIGTIIEDGEILITNVKVAAEYRELSRRERVKADKKARIAQLKKESAECEDTYKELEKNWELKAEKILPLELYEQIQVQKTACDRLLEKKQDRIEELEQFMDDNDWEFEQDLEFYQKDVMLMGDRIDDFIDKLYSSFLEEITLFEESVNSEREELVRKNHEEWTKAQSDFERIEKETLKERQNGAIARFASIGDKHQQLKEDARNFRHKLEDDFRNLTLAFEHYKFAAILNTEKLDYNIAILKRREVENMRMRSNLKRTVLKLQDQLSDEVASVRIMIQNAKKEDEKLIREINRLKSLNSSALNKLFHAMAIDYHKFMDLWVTNEEKGRRKVLSILEQERFIFDVMLGIKLPPPDLSPLNERPREVHCFIHHLDFTAELRKAEKGDPTAWEIPVVKQESRNADFFQSDSLASVNSKKSNKQIDKKSRSNSIVVEESESLKFLPLKEGETEEAFQNKLMKHLSLILSKETGFLLEEKLRRVLSPMLEKEKTLVQFDTMLHSLGIRTLEEMRVLANYMLKNCTVMRGLLSKIDEVQTPILESMQVSLEGILLPSESSQMSSSIQTTILSRISTSLLEQDKNNEEEEEDEEEIKKSSSTVSVVIPKKLYCTQLKNHDHISQDEEIEQEEEDEEEEEEEYEEDEDGAKGSHSHKIKLKKTCKKKKKEGEFDSNASTVLSWYEKSVIKSCDCLKNGEECTCELPPPPQVPPQNNEENEETEEEMSILMSGVGDKDRGSGGGHSASTPSINSLATSSVSSSEFLYIASNDVLRALANFLKEFNAQTKLERVSEEDRTRGRMSRLKFPNKDEMEEYWAKFIPLVQSYDEDFWDSLLYSFQKYSHMLKKRNEYITEVEQIKRQNIELSCLLKNHMREHPMVSIDLDRATIPFC